MRSNSSTRRSRRTVHLAFAIAAGAAVAWAVSQNRNWAEETQPQSDPADNQSKVSIEVARDRAKLMHQIYLATLETMHERYFHGERAMVPARAMEDVFAEVERKSKTKARWISVNARAMGINHEPKSDFEKKAAAELSAGKDEVEVKAEGYYWRAAAIPLTDGCIACHTGSFIGPSKTPRMAALLIGVPVAGE